MNADKPPSAIPRSTGVPTDEDLLARIAAGDLAAMGPLYNRYAHLMIGVGMSVLRSRMDAEDLAHDLFVKLTERASQYRVHVGTVRAWLSCAMRNACIDRQRRAAHRIGVRSQVANSIRPAHDDDGERVVRVLDGERAMRALEALAPVQRRTIEDLYCHDMSGAELARRLDVPLGTIKSRAARAILALRNDLLGDGQNDYVRNEAA